MTGTLLTTLEVAERLGLSSAAVAHAVRTGALLPTARTNEDFLFTERAVAAFAESRADAAATPLEPPPAVSRGEWSGDVDRLNTWLKDLSESAPGAAAAAAAAAAPPAPPDAHAAPAAPAAPVPAPVPIATPEEARPAIDFRPPPHPVA
ncbi:MAG TPA: helix-turn-helix domain-containing protein, partial [Candidatus Limnocylindria bacterium]